MKAVKSTVGEPDSPVKSSRSVFKKLLITMTFALLFMALGFYALRQYEYAVTFHPAPYLSNSSWKLPQDAEDVWLTTSDHVRLHGWYVRSKTAPDWATVIFFHGNGGNISNVGWLGESLSRRGYNVLLFDYRGYGRSEGKISGERDLYVDADAAYDYVINQLGVATSKVVLYGQSLGTAGAADLAFRKACGAMILESGMSSASSLAATILPWLPHWLHRLGKSRFDTALKMAHVHCPVLITHGDPDSIIPTENARQIYAAANEPKRILLYPGADHNVFGSGGEKYLDEVSRFIKESIGGHLNIGLQLAADSTFLLSLCNPIQGLAERQAVCTGMVE
jgi:uncharacterized protein